MDSFNAKGEAPPVPPLPAEILEAVEVDSIESIGSEKRGRILLRATSIDLTDEDGDSMRDKGVNVTSVSETERNLVLSGSTAKPLPSSGTLGRDGTLMGYDEIWESNPQMLIEHPSVANESHQTDPEEKNIKKDSKKTVIESWGGLAPPNVQKVVEEDNLIYPSPHLEQRTKQMSLGSFEIGEAKNIKYKLESHSLDELGHLVHIPVHHVDTTVIHKKKHSRQQSISVLNWSKSEDLYQKPRSSNLERMIADSKRINKQLECYDEALRELAKVSLVKKQHSLPDPPLSRYIGAKTQRYLSLPRTNELIDEAFKEIGQSSANMKRTSLSLPRTITPRDMEMAAEVVKKRKVVSNRRRADSEGETFTTTGLKGHINRSLSFDVKLQGSSSSSLPKTPALINKNTPGSCNSAQIITSAPPDKGLTNSEKPLRKKRKILLAMRCFRKYGERESVSGTSPTEASEEESSEDPPFWLSTDKSGALERQSTVIEKVDFCPKPLASPSSLIGAKNEDMYIEEEQSEVKNVIVEFHEEGSNITVKEECISQLQHPENVKLDRDTGTQGATVATEVKEIGMPRSSKKTDVVVQITECQEDNEEVDVSGNGMQVNQEIEFSLNKRVAPLPTEEKTTPSANFDKVAPTEHNKDAVAAAAAAAVGEVCDTLSPGHLTPLSSKEGESHGELFGDSVSTSHLSSASVDHEDPRGLDFHKDSQSEGDSGGSQNDITPQHQLSLKHSHNLLKEHLRAATAERGRLQETAAQLGEQAEKLKYELADAKEAARSREEVVSLLHRQLSDLESKYSKVLEETHHYRLRLGNAEQELRHLNDVCNKYEEEKAQLLELLQQKDQELNDQNSKMTAKEEDRKSTVAVIERDRENAQKELMIQMIYLEEENRKISEVVENLEKKNNDLQRALEDVTAQNEFLTEENNRIFTQSSVEIKSLEDESTCWKDMFESGVKKLSEQLSVSSPCVLAIASAVGGETELLKLVDKYKKELNDVVLQFENVKDKISDSLCQESLNGHPEFQEEISVAIQILKKGYVEIEEALRRHNRTLQELTAQLSIKSLPSENVDHGEVPLLKRCEPNVQKQSLVLLSQLKQIKNTDDITVKTSFMEEMEYFLENLVDILQNVNAETANLNSQVGYSLSEIFLANKESSLKQHRLTLLRCHSEESNVHRKSVPVVNELLKENRALRNEIQDLKDQEAASLYVSEKQKELESVMEENKCLGNKVEEITKIYDELSNTLEIYKNENDKLRLDITSLEYKLKEVDCKGIVEKLSQENRDYKLKNDSLEKELDSFRISKFSKSSQTCDEEIAEIVNENESIKTELECAKKQLSHLESELSRIAQIKDFQFLFNSDKSTKTVGKLHNSNLLDEICMMRHVEKIIGSQSIVSNAFKGFSELISQLCQENQTLKEQLKQQEIASTNLCPPYPSDGGSISAEIDISMNPTRASLYCSRSLDSEDDNGCENLAASVTSDSCEEGDVREIDKLCVSGNCESKPCKEKHCSGATGGTLPASCIAELINDQDKGVEFERNLSSPPTKDDADIIPLSLQYLIDPRNRETEFTCKNTAAHPKEYSHKNGKPHSDDSKCQSCNNSHKANEKSNEKSVLKDVERGTRKSPRNSEESETAVWNFSIINGCDKHGDLDKTRKLLKDKCCTGGSMDEHVAYNKSDYPSEVGYFLVDGKEKMVEEEFYKKEKETVHQTFVRSKETPSKTLATFTDLSNFPSTFKTLPNYMHGCSSDLMERSGNSLETCAKTCTWPCRDAATNTNTVQTSFDLLQELQHEREKSRRNQQSMKKLKAEVQVLRGMLGDVRKGGKIEGNLSKQNTYSSPSTSCCSASNGKLHVLSSAPVSPLRFDQTLAEFQRKVVDLEQKLREENSMRWGLELQVNKMKYELKEKMQLEKDLDSLRCQMEKEFVSRYELEQLKRSYEIALQRAKQEAESAVRDDVSSRLHQINTVIEKQMQEQSRYEQMRSSSEAQIRQDFQDTRLKLLSELARVQNALQEKGEKELELRQKCEKLSKECDKKHDMRRKKLIEKSYSINLAPYSSMGKEKEYVSKVGVVHHRSLPSHIPAQHSLSVPAKIPDSWPGRVPMNHYLRRELEKSIRKHSSTDPSADQTTASVSHATTDENLKILKNKYFLH